MAMGVIRTIITLVTLANHANGYHRVSREDGDMSLVLEPQLRGGFYLVINRGEERQLLGHIGRTLGSNYILENLDEGVRVRIGTTNLTVETKHDLIHDGYGVRMSWEADENTRLEDCIDFGAHHWYGGKTQTEHYPIEGELYSYSSSVTKTSNQERVVERYWLNSNGEYYYVHQTTPLFVDYNSILNNHLCLSAQLSSPYSSKREKTTLNYDYWVFANPVTAHKHAIDNYLGKLSSEPDLDITKESVWSTTAEAEDIDDDYLIDYANKIINIGFNASVLLIGESWERCYGSFEANEDKFKNFTQTIQDLKVLGFRVSIWVHPFINADCDPFYTEAIDKGYIVRNEAGDSNITWRHSNSSESVHVDFTNNDAAVWWASRVLELMERYQIDGVECYAGESSLSPQLPVQYGSADLHPNQISAAYVKTCTLFDKLVQVNVGVGTQSEPVYLRSPELNSTWDNTGLSSMIPTLLQMNIIGYPLIVPESIGGGSTVSSKELYIRWLQATTFMPVMKFSYGPWNFDNETVQITKKYMQLHNSYGDLINNAITESVRSGRPVNAPIWWADPLNNQTFSIDDEYLLGDTILVAPVLIEGATSRDVYLPAGSWLAEGNQSLVLEGPVSIKDYPAPLDTLPYFIRVDEPSSVGTLERSVALVMFINLLYLILR